MKRRFPLFSIYIVFIMILLFPVAGQAQSLDKALIGTDRIQTAILVSQEAYERSNTVLLAPHSVFPDALSGIPLAKKYEAPILFCHTASVDPAVLQEIQRLDARRVILLGGRFAPIVTEQLQEEGLTVQTVWGQNRYETNRSIVKNAYQAKDVTQALLVSGEAFADAVSASALAYREDIPIFLVSQADQGLMEIREDFPHLSSVIVIGGIERVSASVEACFPEVIRIAGTNRYETSRKVDEAFFSDQKQVTAIGMPPENYIDLNYPQFHAKPESVEKAIQVFYEEEIRPNDTLEIKTLATPAAWEPSSAVMDHRNIRDGVKRFKIKNPDVCCTYYLQHQNTMHYGENLDSTVYQRMDPATPQEIALWQTMYDAYEVWDPVNGRFAVGGTSLSNYMDRYRKNTILYYTETPE